MKKYLVIAFAIIAAHSSTYALTDAEIIAQLEMASNYLETALRDPNTKTTVQDEVMNKWGRVFNDAKNFATDNSKTAGVKDSTLTNALQNIDKFNTSVIDTIKYSRMGSVQNLTNQKNLITPMQGYVTSIINELNGKSFTLHHKIRAQKVIVAMGKGLHKIILAAVQYISSRASGIGQAPARPSSNTPQYTPSTPASNPPVRQLPSIPSPSVFMVTAEMKQFFMNEIDYNHERTFLQSITLKQGASLKNIFEKVLIKFKEKFSVQLQPFAYNQMIMPLYDSLAATIQSKYNFDTQSLKFVKDNLTLALLVLKN